MSASAKTYAVHMARIRIGHADYRRPCVVVQDGSDPSTVWVLALSTKNYGEASQNFAIESSHPDFKATGLSATSFTIHPMRLIAKGALGQQIGIIEGVLADEFRDEFGLD